MTQQLDLSCERQARPRRVAVFVGNYADVVDGVSKTTRRLVTDLRERGDEVQVFAPCGPRPAMSMDPTQVHLPSIPLFGFGQTGYRYALGLGPKGREVLERFAPDLIHVASPDRASQQAMRWGRAHGVPLVGSFHTNFASYFRYLRPWRWMEGVAWRFTTRFYNAFDRVLVPTASMLNELREHGMRTPACVWSRGVDLTQFSPTRRDHGWRRRLGIDDDEVVVTFVARLYWEKGIRKLAHVLETLERRGVAHRVLIVGDGPGEEFLRGRLPRARFTGFLAGEDLSRAYASGDIFLYPSETDTFGNVTLEAMASGLPVVGANAPGTRCVVGDSRGATLCAPEDLEGMARGVERLVRDSAFREDSARASRQRATFFSWAAIMTELSRDYDRVIAGSSARPALRSSSARAALG